MQQITNFLSEPWVGSTLGILGILAAVVFYLRSKRISRLAYQRDEVAIIGGSSAAFPSEVVISFAGSPVARVSATRFVVWNAGNTTLDRSQIVDADHLRLDLHSDGEILKVELLRTTREVNTVWAKSKPSERSRVDFGFDYLDPNDGFLIEVLHSGQRGALQMAGTLRGLPDGLTDYGRSPWYFERIFRTLPFPFNRPYKPFLVTTLIIGVLFMLAGILMPIIVRWAPSLAEKKPSDPFEFRWLLLLAGMLYAGFPLCLLWVRRRRYPNSLEPTPKDDAEPDGAANGSQPIHSETDRTSSAAGSRR
jgi:hypothetical protein